MKITKNHKNVEKTINKFIWWDSHITGYFNNDLGNRAYIHLNFNDDNTKIKVGVQDFDISNQFNYFYLEV
jgi:hypothetical protein